MHELVHPLTRPVGPIIAVDDPFSPSFLYIVFHMQGLVWGSSRVDTHEGGGRPLSPSLRLTYTVPGRQLQDSPGCFGLGCRTLVYSGNILHDTVQSMFVSLACWHRSVPAGIGRLQIYPMVVRQHIGGRSCRPPDMPNTSWNQVSNMIARVVTLAYFSAAWLFEPAAAYAD